MLCQDISFPSPQENILYDEVLLHLAEQGMESESLRFWEAKEYFIVLGRIGKTQEDIHLKAAGQDRIPILRRYSGGGTVLQGKGCLNYSLVLSKERGPDIADLRKSYQYVLLRTVGALQTLGVEAAFKPISDIALAGSDKKVSGNAQHRGKKFILHHGTILYDFDLSLIEKYLQFPQSVPEYRRGRSHLEFVANIDRDPQAVKKALRKAFGVPGQDAQLTRPQKDCLKTFLETRQVIF